MSNWSMAAMVFSLPAEVRSRSRRNTAPPAIIGSVRWGGVTLALGRAGIGSARDSDAVARGMNAVSGLRFSRRRLVFRFGARREPQGQLLDYVDADGLHLDGWNQGQRAPQSDPGRDRHHEQVHREGNAKSQQDAAHAWKS